VRRAHAPAAAARHGFDHDGVTDLLGDFQRFLLGFNDPVRARVTGTPALRAVARAMFLSPIARIASLLGPMNLMWQLSQTSAKCAFSARKTVAWMDRIDVADFGRRK
jgi:hypothetical protein